MIVVWLTLFSVSALAFGAAYPILFLQVAVFGLVSWAGFDLAHLKRRPDKATLWSCMCFVMPLALPVLTLWRMKPGQPSRKSIGAIVLVTLMNLFVLVQVAIATEEVVSYGNLMGYPSCSSPNAVQGLRSRLRQTGQDGHSAVDVTGIVNARERPANPPEVAGDNPRPRLFPPRNCVAEVRFSDASERTINYVISRRSLGYFESHANIMYVDLKIVGLSRPMPWGVRLLPPDSPQ